MEKPESYTILCRKMEEIYRRMDERVKRANDAIETGADGMTDVEEKEHAADEAQYRKLGELKKRNESLMGLKNEQISLPVAEIAGKKLDDHTRKTVANYEHRSSEQYHDAFESYIRNGERTNPAELRVLNEGTGGSYLMPIEYQAGVVAKLQTMNPLRRLAQNLPMGSYSRQVAYEATTATAYWATEATTVTDAAPTFSKLTLTPARLTAICRISNELIQDFPARGPGSSIESVIQEQLSRVLAQTEDTAAFATTDVSGAPTSLFTTGSVPSTTAASATAVTADDLISFIYKCPLQYRMHPSYAIVVSDNLCTAMRKLSAFPVTQTSVGTNPITSAVAYANTYLWQNGYGAGGALAAGQPPTIDGHPVYVSAGIVDIAASKYVAMAGAWDYCKIAYSQNLEVKVLRERYADANETGFMVNERVAWGWSLPTLAASSLIMHS